MEYLNLIEQYRESMVKTLQELIAIRSVCEPEDADMPFGRGVHDAFLYMLEKGNEEGFEAKNIDNYAGHIEFGASDEILGILVHLDTVPEGNDWDFPPLGGQINDGKLYGRGANDNKGPAVAAFYAMKALKDSGFLPDKKVRLIMGLDEETKWRCMSRYFEKEKAPAVGFAPDAKFPAIHAEMGILVFELAKKMGKSNDKGLELRSLKGGNASNMVADFARAVVRDEKTDTYDKIRSLAASYRNEKGYKVNVKGTGKSLEITTSGISAHGARPDLGLNAISIMMEFLGHLSFVNEDTNEFIAFYNEHIGFTLDGAGMGCGLSDEISGKLIFNVGMADIGPEAARLTINIRYPVTTGGEDVYEAMMPVINRYNLGIVKGKHQLPIYFAEDHPLITSLMEVYRKHTGDEESKPIVIGGGTYARAAANIVAFGPSMPDDPDIAHQKNEFIEIDQLVLIAKIYADAIKRLASL